MDEAIINYIKKEYKLLIGQQTAEEIKLEIGSAYPLKEEVQAEVRGRDMLTGLPKTVVITSEEVRRALDEPVDQIIDAIKSTLDKTPPELAADIMDRGIVLAGGGALLQRPRRAPAPRDADAGAPRRVAAHLRRGRLGPQPRGVRGHPPLEPQPRARRNGLCAPRPGYAAYGFDGANRLDRKADATTGGGPARNSASVRRAQRLREPSYTGSPCPGSAARDRRRWA